MSTAATSAVQLLKLDDGQFDRTIQDMSVKRLMDTISVLQKEMSREQENFNCLSTELSSLKKSSGQYKSVSKDMTASQTKLTLLMNRSMKCFTLQGNLQSKAALERKNSFKGSQPAGVQNKKSEPVKSSDQLERIDNAKRTLAEVSDNRTKGDNSANTDTPNIQVQSMTSRNSFSDLRSKFNGANSQNGGQTNNFNTKSNVSSNIVRSQSSVSADQSKRLSDNVLSTVTPDVNVKSNNANTNNAVNGSKSSVFNSNSKTSSSGQKPSGTSSNNALQGPIANQQNRFLSKSTDNVFNKPSASVTNKPDVVQGLKPSKPRPMVVMNVDKQVIDLDSFTDRKNMLGELKSFRKDLKNIDKTHLKPVSSEEENTKVAKETESKHTPAKLGTLFGEIQAAKKPSELKVAKNIAVKEKQNGTHINEYTHNGGSKDEPTKSVVKSGGDDSHIQLFDDLLKDYDDEDSDNASGDSPREVTVVTKSQAEGINSGNAVSSEITLVHTRGSTPMTESSEDNLSESSGVSEDEDRFVTEFNFTQPQSKQKTAVPQVSQSKGKIVFVLFCLGLLNKSLPLA